MINKIIKKRKITTILIAVSTLISSVVLFSCNNKTTSKQSYLKLQDGSTYTINTSYNDFLTNRTTSGTFDFQDNKGVNQTINRDEITEIHLTDLKKIKNAPDNYLANLCHNMTNLKVADISIPQSITSVGNSFCEGMFFQCSSLQSINSNFNIPKKITSIGTDFCTKMFSVCTKISSFPTNFNIPQNIISVKDNFCSEMFYGDILFYSLPTNFNLPQKINGDVGNNFCGDMFSACTSLTKLPNKFNLPQQITSCGNKFCYYMFNRCDYLFSLPKKFNLPQGITSVGNSFCGKMFNECNSLQNTHSIDRLVKIHIPSPTTVGTDFCTDMFAGSWTTNYPTPHAGYTATVNDNIE